MICDTYSDPEKVGSSQNTSTPLMARAAGMKHSALNAKIMTILRKSEHLAQSFPVTLQIKIAEESGQGKEYALSSHGEMETIEQMVGRWHQRGGKELRWGLTDLQRSRGYHVEMEVVALPKQT